MPRSRFALGVLSLALLTAGPAASQCILANPSFELSGFGGGNFDGWNQFGNVGATGSAPHGSAAARVSGPNSGNWDVSAYWQPLDTSPGETWDVGVRVWHSSSAPLVGANQAIVNVEWRDSGGNLISYESYAAATAATPTDAEQQFSVQTPPAPAGAVSARILLGVLQSPTDPSPDVFYDLVRFESTPAATYQWNDFPGGRTIDFSGRTWRVKGPGFYGPGPNLFCDSSSCTWVDGNGRLHLTVKQTSGAWRSTEVVLEDPLGYGDYRFTTFGDIDTLHPNVVFGLFLWEYGPCYEFDKLWWNPFNEIDVELSRWGDVNNQFAQFVAQPFDYPGNIHRFDLEFEANELVTHAFRWLADRVEYRCWRGGPADESPGTMVREWTYTGPHIPRPEIPRVHLNLWYIDTPPTTTQEVVLEEFTFIPEGAVVSAPELPVGAQSPRLLAAASPNPFRPPTRLDFTLERAAWTELAVFDVTGRRVRTLMAEERPAGSGGAAWDGRDDDGRPVAAGTYFYQLRTGSTVETRRLVLLR